MKLLVLLPRVPYPLEKGDKLRAFYQIKELSKYHDIYLVALQDGALHPEALEKISPYCKEIHLIKLTLFSKFRGVSKYSATLQSCDKIKEACRPHNSMVK